MCDSKDHDLSDKLFPVDILMIAAAFPSVLHMSLEDPFYLYLHVSLSLSLNEWQKRSLDLNPMSSLAMIPPPSFFFFFLVFLGLHLQHMEIPRPGVESEL